MPPVQLVDHARPRPRRWTSRRALLLHLAAIVWVPGCGVACWWQVTVALAGDSLGWLYSIEWPAFGVFGLVVWWSLVHDDPTRAVRPATPRVRSRAASEAVARSAATTRSHEEEPSLAAYNDYLEALAEQDRAKTWRR